MNDVRLGCLITSSVCIPLPGKWGQSTFYKSRLSPFSPAKRLANGHLSVELGLEPGSRFFSQAARGAESPPLPGQPASQSRAATIAHYAILRLAKRVHWSMRWQADTIWLLGKTVQQNQSTSLESLVSIMGQGADVDLYDQAIARAGHHALYVTRTPNVAVMST